MADAATQTSPLLIEVSDTIKTITINRPHRKNALDHETQALIREAVEDSVANPDVRVTIITGAGGDFSAGADLNPQMGAGAYDVTKHLKEDLNPIILAMRNSNKPFIAKVRGNCVGFGCNVALACDLIYAAEDARFCQIFTRIALSSDGGGAYFMPQAMGYVKAFEKMALNEMIPAPEAERLNLINRAVADGELDGLVEDAARRLATGPFVAIQNTKSNLRAGVNGTLEEALEAEAENQGINFRSEDFKEGVMAFLQKRKAQYKGR